MLIHSESILLLESVPYTQSSYAEMLGELGYGYLHYADYGDEPKLDAPAGTLDGVVAVWMDRAVGAEQFAHLVARATAFPRARGALIISPFATEENARLLARSGAKGWARPPLAKAAIAQRLSYVLHGERRQRPERVVADRRREPVYPVALPA